MFLVKTVYRLKCKECGKVLDEDIHFATGKRTYTNKLARLVTELSGWMTIKDMAQYLHLTWDTVKDIQKRFMKRRYGNPELSNLKYIGIDEFAVAKGHKYKTIVANLANGQVVYIGDGRDKASLDKFWKKVKKAGAKIEVVATDMSRAFTSALRKFGRNLAAKKDQVLAWYDNRISTGKLEGINDKIKTMKRQAYGYRDMKFFELKILAMYDPIHSFVG